MVDLFDTITINIVIVGENNCCLYHNGNGVNIALVFGFVCPIIEFL
jgi:hypothetical protein